MVTVTVSVAVRGVFDGRGLRALLVSVSGGPWRLREMPRGEGG